MNPDIYARMVALCGEISTIPYADKDGHVMEARSIMALVNPPVDPDLIEARKSCQLESAPQADGYLSGRLDGSMSMRCALASLKRGRELQKAEPSEAVELLKQARAWTGSRSALTFRIEAFLTRHGNETGQVA